MSTIPIITRGCRWTCRTSASSGPQPLHPLHALRARVRRGGGRACLGCGVARHPLHAGMRYEPALGRIESCTSCGKCVQVCPTGALAEKGFAVEEMIKRDAEITCLAIRRGGQSMKKARLATVWLDGCSGCHMSLLDIDEAIIAVPRRRSWFTGRWWTRRSFPRALTSPSSKAPSVARTIWRKIAMSGSARILVALGRLRRHRQRFGDAQSVSGEDVLERAYVEGADMQQSGAHRWRAGAAEASRTAARRGQSRPARARLSAVGQGDPVRSGRTAWKAACPS